MRQPSPQPAGPSPLRGHEALRILRRGGSADVFRGVQYDVACRLYVQLTEPFSCVDRLAAQAWSCGTTRPTRTCTSACAWSPGMAVRQPRKAGLQRWRETAYAQALCASADIADQRLARERQRMAAACRGGGEPRWGIRPIGRRTSRHVDMPIRRRQGTGRARLRSDRLLGKIAHLWNLKEPPCPQRPSPKRGRS
jgi:hypothetical protein